MKKYDNFNNKIINLENTFETLEDKKISSLKNNYPLLPNDYCLFLKEIGYGRLGSGFYQFYSGLVDYDEIYGYLNEETKDLLLFGDDYQGYCNGFNPNDNWCIVEVSEGDADITKICDTFEEFVNSLIEDIE